MTFQQAASKRMQCTLGQLPKEYCKNVRLKIQQSTRIQQEYYDDRNNNQQTMQLNFRD